MIERQRRDHDLLARTPHVRLHECLELLGIGDKVAVGERRAFGETGGPARILQEQQIIAGEPDRRELEIRALLQGISKSDRVGKPRINCRTRKFGGGAVAWRRHNDVLDRGLVDDLGERRRDAAEDHDRLYACVVELMLQLTWRVERVDIHLNGAGAHDAQHGEREGRDIGQHHSDAVAFAHVQPVLQIGREIA